jgi:hypothetical protein
VKRQTSQGSKTTKLLARRTAKAATPARSAKAPSPIDEATLLGDLRTLVQSARQRIAAVAYSTQTMLCWRVRQRLSQEYLQGAGARMASRFS